jgi:hypothetical protein
MLTISGSISTKQDAELAENLYLLQEHKSIMSMIQDYEMKKMSPTEEISFLQYLLDSGLVWVMPESYTKKTKEYLAKNLLYFN